MHRIDFYSTAVINGCIESSRRFSYYGTRRDLPILLSEWIDSKVTILQLIANIAAEPKFTTWYASTDCRDFPQLAIRPVLPNFI